ncbi:MAG: class I SAM-dependent methyltransferase [Elusimicrobia bacterium]|nr:class I SAM-dependent methyltransferase [Elusimicrobiota bacterium]
MKGISKILETLFLNERKRIVEKFKKPPGALLDLGCGTGGFLKVMARGGWKAQGIEKSDKIKKYSTEENKIYCADLLDMKFDGGSFDVITLWQVLEHLSDPKKYLAEINRLLKEDGILVVSVPNIGSMQAKFGANKWFHLDVPRHIWHFTPETVSELLRRAGFRVKEIKHFSLEYNSFGWWQSIFNLLGCEINFIYKYLKRGAVQKEYATAKRIYTILCAVLLSLLFLLFAFILSFIESALLRGGVITVVAEKGGDI